MADKIFYSHDYSNDTTYLCEQDTDGMLSITMTFTSEDPDYGTEELIYRGDGTEQELRDDLLEEITEYLDLKETARWIPDYLQYYDEDFIKTSLIAFEAMLMEMKGE